MATISENLQIIADSTAAIKQAIIDKGGNVTGDITTWANAISEIGNNEESSLPLNIVLTENSNIDNAKIYEYLSNLSLNGAKIMDGNVNNFTRIEISYSGIRITTNAGTSSDLNPDGTFYINGGNYA